MCGRRLSASFTENVIHIRIGLLRSPFDTFLAIVRTALSILGALAFDLNFPGTQLLVAIARMFSICSKHNDSVESVENCFCFVSFRINYSAYDALRQVLFGFLSCASRSIIIIMSFYFSPQFHFEQKRITHSLNSEHMKL